MNIYNSSNGRTFPQAQGRSSEKDFHVQRNFVMIFNFIFCWLTSYAHHLSWQSITSFFFFCLVNVRILRGKVYTMFKVLNVCPHWERRGRMTLPTHRKKANHIFFFSVPEDTMHVEWNQKNFSYIHCVRRHCEVWRVMNATAYTYIDVYISSS